MGSQPESRLDQISGSAESVLDRNSIMIWQYRKSRDGSYVGEERGVLQQGEGWWLQFRFLGELHSDALISAVQRIAPFALFRCPVMIIGESGTGKELLAESIHLSSGAKGRFVAVNCAAIPPTLAESVLFGYKVGAFTGAKADTKGLVDEAIHGTLFLDEIQELPLLVQGKLLRFLNDGGFFQLGGTSLKRSDARIVTATNVDIKDLLASRQLREDLVSRLNVGQIVLPPLREQPKAIFAVFQKLVEESRGLGFEQTDENNALIVAETSVKFEDGIESILMRYHWPGNYRELRNCAQRCYIMSRPTEGMITCAMVAEAILQRPSGDTTGSSTLVSYDKTRITGLLQQYDGNVAEVARQMKMERTTLSSMMKRLGVNPAAFRSRSKRRQSSKDR